MNDKNPAIITDFAGERVEKYYRRHGRLPSEEPNMEESDALLAASPDDYWAGIIAEIEAAGHQCRHALLLNHQAAHLLSWAKIARNAAKSSGGGS